MNDQNFSDELLRNFLLGRVEELQREQVEDSFLVDAEIRERVLIVEQELTEEYLEGNLTSEDNERFAARYAQTPEQQQQLRVAKSLKKYAIDQAAVAVPQSSFVHQFKLRPVFLTLVTVAIVVLVASVWLMMRGRGSELQAELARLNSSAGANEVPGQTLEIRPIAVRGGGTEVEVRGEAGIVELRLTWLPSQQYSRYKARLRRVGDDQWFTILDLQARNDVVPVRIPANQLQRGSYQLELSGVASDSVAVEYVFRVITAETQRKD